VANVVDFLKVSGGIASAAMSGGTSAAILAGIAGVGKLLSSGDNNPPDLNDRTTRWTVERIQEWMQIALDFMQRPMRKGLKAELLRDKIASDWYEFFGTKAKDSWVNQHAEQTWNAVKTNIALGIIEAPTAPD